MIINEKNLEEARKYLSNLLAPDLSYEGSKINVKKYENFKKLSNNVLDFFRKFKGYDIRIDASVQYKESADISIYIPEFEMDNEAKEQFIEILNLAEYMYCANTPKGVQIGLSIYNIWE